MLVLLPPISRYRVIFMSADYGIYSPMIAESLLGTRPPPLGDMDNLILCPIRNENKWVC